MKVKDFDGNEYNWPLKGHQPTFDETRPRSQLHLDVRALLRGMYPTSLILEEVPLPGTGLFIDFYLPLRKVVVECHGKQHYQFIQHFHIDKRGFIASNNRDMRKLDWCHKNNLKVAILSHAETIDEWRTRIELAAD